MILWKNHQIHAHTLLHKIAIFMQILLVAEVAEHSDWFFFMFHSRMQSLGPINARLRPAQASGSKGSNKTTPLKASHNIAHSVPSPDSGSASPDSTVTSSDGVSSPSNQDTNKAITLRNYDLNMNVAAEGSSEMSHQVSHSSKERDYPRAIMRDDSIRRRDGSGGGRRMLSPARVKVVPVGSILDPQADLASGRPFMPTPPPSAEKPHLPRPSSAERFRKMVMHYREAT